MAQFAKRHYEAFATLMQQECPNLPRHKEFGGEYDDEGYDHDALGRQLMWDDMLGALVRLFTNDNPRFDSRRFAQACKPSANVKARKVA